MKYTYILFVIILIANISQSFAQQTVTATDEVDTVITSVPYSPLVPVDSLIAEGKTYLGLPYRTTVRAPWPLDCSGYVSMLYGKYGVKLPHSSGGIAQVTKTISIKDAQPGDLIFFKGRDSRKNRVGHVALIIEVNDDHLIMMHSTNSKGIIVEPYPDGYYYTRRFVKVGRL